MATTEEREVERAEEHERFVQLRATDDREKERVNDALEKLGVRKVVAP